MKKIFKQKNKILCIVLACCMLATAFVPFGAIEVSAASEEQYVAQVGSTKYENYRQAWDAVKNGGTVLMLADWHIAEMLAVEKNASVTVNMNGHMINRGLTSRKDNGEIFLVKENGSLMLDGNGVTDTEYMGTVRNGKWNYRENGRGTVKINGSLLTGGYNDNGGGAIHIQKNAEVRIDGVTVAGNACSDGDDGGAIRLQGEYAKLYLSNSTVAYNRSDNGGGAAVWVEETGCMVEIINTKIHHNLADDDDGDGGAIQINGGNVTIKKSVISFNEAGRNGGAVYVYNGNLAIDKDTVISYNVAKKEGGAVYADSKADEVKLEGCFIGNSANEEGGAVYVNSNISGNSGVRISNAEMIGNIANGNGGGAVYVDSDDEVALSGKVIMHGNSPDNLHIRDEENIWENSLTAGSKIGIYTYWDATEDYYPIETGNYRYFFSDKVGYEVKGDGEKLYFVKGAEGAPSSYKAGNSEYAIIKSAFLYTSKVGGARDSYFYYSDGYFAEAPKYYNEHLSSLAASMALAAMPAVYEGEYSADKTSKYIVDMFVSMGYSNIYVHYPEPEYFGGKAENLSTIGYAIAKKTVVINGEETVIIATAVRGADYRAEWVSNVTLGDGFGEAKGFGDAARQVKQGIDAYIANNGIDTDSAKFFITGYSRAAATSNLVAKKLTDIYGEDKVYAYCFEAPKGGALTELKDGIMYTNIHNVINRVDVVTTVGTEQMGFIRYGIDHIVPAHKVGTDEYDAQKELMLAQLAAINENIKHNDEFQEATMEYFASTVDFFGVIFDLIDPEWFPDYENAEDWIPHFIEKIQEYSMTDMTDKSAPDSVNGIFDNESDDWYGYRNFYAGYKWYLYFDEADENKIKIKCYDTEPDDFDSGKYTVLSLEEAIGNLMMFYFGSSNEKKETIASSLDVEKIMSKMPMYHLWTVVIDEWHELSIDTKNKEFNELWGIIDIEDDLKKVLTNEECKTLMTSFYVAADFLLDFVAEDYHYTDQNILGTLVYNIGNILQTHSHDIAYSWVRSYDSFYSDIKYACKHSYGEWSVVKEATNEDYGVQLKSCTHCGESMYEAIPKTVTEEEESQFPASLFGEGSAIVLIFATVAIVAVGAAVYFYTKLKKVSPNAQNDDE